jgi:hypothetical protein
MLSRELSSLQEAPGHEDSTPNRCGRLSTHKTKAIPPFTENAIRIPATSGRLAERRGYRAID